MSQRHRRWGWVVFAALALSLAAGCGPAQPSGVAVAPEASATPPAATAVPEPTATPLADLTTYSRADIAEAGLGVEIPAGWARQEPEWNWSPVEGEGMRIRVGVKWADLQPPMEAEAALLPNPAQVLQSDPVELAWGSGRRITLEVLGPAPEGTGTQAPVQSVETHVLVVVQRDGGRWAYDLFVAAPTAEELAGIVPVLDHLVGSATPIRKQAMDTQESESGPNQEGSGTAAPPAAEDTGLTTYTSQKYRVVLQMPDTWQPVAGYDERYGGPDGFVELAAISAENTPLGQICPDEAQHQLQPYGSQPLIQYLRLQGQDACLILPSNDQPAEMRGQAALIARNQQPVQFQGQGYDYLVLWADQAHIRGLADSLRFLSSSSGETMTLKIYFGNDQLNPGQVDCGLVYPVTRTVAAVPSVAEAALAELFAGPTEAERQQGYTSWFSSDTQSILKRLKVVGETAYLDLTDIRWIISGASTSCGSRAFLSQVETTLKAVVPVDRVIYAIDGDPATFYEWMQFGCDPNDNYCDKTPFLEP